MAPPPGRLTAVSARRYLAPAAAVRGYGIGGPDATMPVPWARDRRAMGGKGGPPYYLGSPRAFLSITPRGQGRSSSRSLRSAPAQAPVRVLAGAAAAAAARAAGRAPALARVPAGAVAAAGVPVAGPAVPATVWAAATAASGAAGRDRQVLRRRARRARGKALLASGDDSPPGADYAARRRMRLAEEACPVPGH